MLRLSVANLADHDERLTFKNVGRWLIGAGMQHRATTPIVLHIPNACKFSLRQVEIAGAGGRPAGINYQGHMIVLGTFVRPGF
ncbi:hypothetical protein Rwratislav_43696 [Rhodococcus wratislaviensis IFP 2016]|nr:hypothetical protein Rwratislav_43696 [Rhodococcus wratislaviensis IFP 2016]